MEISFFVPGIPAPQGSKRHVGGGRMVESCKALLPWRDSVIAAAMQYGGIKGPVSATMSFCFPRPKGHYGKNGLKSSSPLNHITKPDIDKLCRAVLDALTIARTIEDDSRVFSLSARKCYTEMMPGMLVTITEVSNAHP